MELTTALLHVFNAPDDKIVYDVGHQAYVHKMLTGRRRLMPTIRQTGGISGASLLPHWGCMNGPHWAWTAELSDGVNPPPALHIVSSAVLRTREPGTAQGSRRGQRATMTPLALGTARRRSRRYWAWLSAATSRRASSGTWFVTLSLHIFTILLQAFGASQWHI